MGLFEAEGFHCEGVAVQERRIQNRLRQLEMDRRWIQGSFTYIGSHAAGIFHACHTTYKVTALLLWLQDLAVQTVSHAAHGYVLLRR